MARSMNIRTTRSSITFRKPFYLKGLDRLLPPADYRVMTDEELDPRVYRFRLTVKYRPPSLCQRPSGSAVEMVTVDPLDLQAAQELDAMPNDSATARKF